MKQSDKIYTILVIEDEIRLQKAIGDKIKRAGWASLTASNGKEGLRIAQNEKPDLILLDIIMPIMGGTETIRELRKNSDVPVLVLTNLNDENKLAELNSYDNVECMVKSDSPLEDVIKRIREILK